MADKIRLFRRNLCRFLRDNREGAKTRGYIDDSRLTIHDSRRPTVDRTPSRYFPIFTFTMNWLRFLSRLAFICNVMFLLAVALRFRSFVTDPDTVSTLGVIGYFLVFLLNPIVNLCYLGVLIVKRRLRPYVALWLAIANFCFLLLQVTYIFYLNDLLHS
jgi:uncharacterized BrkB/YihY/UPF0761 family membrane protein